jgi:hypothetical protein
MRNSGLRLDNLLLDIQFWFDFYGMHTLEKNSYSSFNFIRYYFVSRNLE